MWKFERLTKKQKKEVREAFDRKDFNFIDATLKQAKVYDNVGGCPTCGRDKTIKKWLEWAIDEQIL